MEFNDHLDPDDWAKAAEFLGNFTEQEVRELAASLESEIWRPVPDQLKLDLAQQPVPKLEQGVSEVIDTYRQQIRPYRNGNTHPRFFGWVQGTGTLAAMLADIAISSLNPNCGGRDHGAVYIERQVVEWCRQIFNFPKTSGGLLTSGTSNSTQLAIQVAMFRKLGIEHKNKGFFGVSNPLRCYASREGHSSIIKAIQTSGIGSDNLIVIETDENHRMLLSDLERQIEEDISKGYLPFLVIANAGTVNTGAFDDFEAINKVCKKHDCWMHVDGAFGAWLKIAGEPYSSLTKGLDLADSLAFDFHKLMYVQYECGGLLVRDGDFHRQVFSIRPDYLSSHGQGLAGGEPWYCDFGMELSRSFRALKPWFTFQVYGLDKLGKAVAMNCALAARLSDQIKASTHWELVNKTTSNIVTFKLKNELCEKNNCLCEAIVTELQYSGEAVFSLTRQGDYRVVRASITNHRTREGDIDEVMLRLNQLAEEKISGI